MTAPTRQHGHDVVKVERACISKNRYPDVLTARAAGMHYIETGQANGEREPPKKLWWYRCVHCGGVHLTSNDNGRKFNVTIF